MDGIGSVWAKLDMRRKLVVIAATLGVFAAILALSRSGTSREMALLYAGLEPSASGEVLAALDQAGVIYDVRAGGIYVDLADRDRLRMTLAGQGLPANGPRGYELLDSLSGFGTTSQMFDAAYWRAKEGELARTIQSSADIRAARVHISTAAGRGFRRDETPTASVAVTAAAGAIGPDRARAIRYLVSSAVPGLSAEDVAVIDGEGNLIAMVEDRAAPGRQGDREDEMRARVERLLAARVGPGNAVVELTIETETDSEQILERRFDPEGRVAISTEVEERTGTSSESGGGEVTVASNLPDGDAGGNGQSNNQTSESRELTNYEVSETQREITRGPGAVKRLTVAVLVNEVAEVDDTGAVVPTPRSEEELADLRELVASAVGFDEARGDVITIRSMGFEAIPPAGSEAGALEDGGAPLDVMTLVQIGVLALVALILGLFVIRPILASRGAAAQGDVPPALALDLPEGRPSGAGATPNLPATVSPQPDESGGFALGDLPTFDMAMYDEATGDAGPDLSEMDPVSRLRKLMEERQDEALQILQSWVDDPESEEVA